MIQTNATEDILGVMNPHSQPSYDGNAIIVQLDVSAVNCMHLDLYKERVVLDKLLFNIGLRTVDMDWVLVIPYETVVTPLWISVIRRIKRVNTIATIIVPSNEMKVKVELALEIFQKIVVHSYDEVIILIGLCGIDFRYLI